MKFIKSIIFIIFIIFILFSFSIKAFSFNLYFGVGILGTTSYPLNFTTDFDLYMKIYEGETVFVGSYLKLKNNNLINFEIGYLSRALYSIVDYYFLLFTGYFKTYFSKSILETKSFSFYFNFGLWASFLFYSVYKNRNFSGVIDVIEIQNFSFLNCGLYLSYMIKLGKFSLDIGSNLGFIDENLKDENYLLSGWFSITFIYFL